MVTCCFKILHFPGVCDQLPVIACDWWDLVTVTLTDCVCMCAGKDNKWKYFPCTVTADICLFPSLSVCLSACLSESVCFVGRHFSQLLRCQNKTRIFFFFSFQADGWQPYAEWLTVWGLLSCSRVFFARTQSKWPVTLGLQDRHVMESRCCIAWEKRQNVQIQSTILLFSNFLYTHIFSFLCKR